MVPARHCYVNMGRKLMMGEAFLDVQDLSISFGGLVALKPLSMQLEPGRLRAIIGPNGAGKSTFINALSGFARASSGRIELDGVALSGLAPHRRVRAGMARTFQNIRLFGSMSVLEVAVTGAHSVLKGGFFATLFGSARLRHEEEQVTQSARIMLDRVGLPSSLHQRGATTLSYGQQRRVEIARALMSQPKLLLLDEPVAGMTVAEKQEIAALIQQLRQDGMTILLIEHDMAFVRGLADEVSVLHHGGEIASGVPDVVFSDRRVRAAYLGKQADR